MSEESNEDDPVNQGLEGEADAEPIEGVEPATPVENDGGPSDAPPSENDVEVEEEPRDPLELAVERAEQAEKEIAYRDAEIQNVRKRLMAEKAEVIQFGGMGLARRMLTILGDVDRAMTGIDEDDESPIAQGLRLLRNKMWHGPINHGPFSSNTHPPIPTDLSLSAGLATPSSVILWFG